jgi:hypothetical protein
MGEFASESELRVLSTLAASFLWVLAVDLFVESHRRSQTTRAVAWLAGIALLFRFQWELWFLVPLLFGALILAVGLSALGGGRERNESFWLFNHRLWLAAAGSDRRMPVRRRPLHHPRDAELPVRARPAVEMA